MTKIAKRLQAVDKNIDRETKVSITDAINLVKENATAKFDETIEVAFRLNLDPRKAEQNLRGMLSLPNGNGKSVRVAVFARGEIAEEAEAAGADIVGAEDLANKIKQGEIDFQRCIASPDMMPIVGALGKILGPKGLMPNPKLGTVTPNVGKAVAVAKAGQIEYRVEKTGIIHCGIGKASFVADKLLENLNALYKELLRVKPAEVKGRYLKGLTISSTMGRGIRVDIASLNQ